MYGNGRTSHVLKEGRKSAIFAIQGFVRSELFLYLFPVLLALELLLFLVPDNMLQIIT